MAAHVPCELGRVSEREAWLIEVPGDEEEEEESVWVLGLQHRHRALTCKHANARQGQNKASFNIFIGTFFVQIPSVHMCVVVFVFFSNLGLKGKHSCLCRPLLL